MSLTDHPILFIMLVAVLAPLLAEIPSRLRLPVVVLEVVLGIVVGPQLLGLVEPTDFTNVMFKSGMAAVLFMAGMEVDFERVRGAPLVLALRGWVISLTIAFVAVAALHVVPEVHAPLMVVIAMATTGLSVILPRLRDSGQLETSGGRMLFAAGVVGEVGPILAVSLALSTRYSTWQEAGYLVAFIAVIAVVAAIGMGARPPKLLALLSRTMESSTQLPVRLSMLLLAATFAASEVLGFEGILGAFAAGMVVGLATRGEAGRDFRMKIDAVCFGWLTPFFFVGTGVLFEADAVLAKPINALLVPALVLLFLLVRGLPTLLYGHHLRREDRVAFALNAAIPSIGLVIVITHVGIRGGVMHPDTAHALVGAALLATLVFPIAASFIEARAAARRTAGG